VITTFGGSALALAAKAATTTIPVVFIVGDDPVRHGLVASLARPGGNLTGINLFVSELVAKRLELLRELVPAATRVAVLVNPTGSDVEITLQDVEPAARAMGLQIRVLNASTSGEINEAFANVVRARPDAIFVDSDPFFNSRRVQLTQLAARHTIPATYAGREYALAGGLTSYGPSVRMRGVKSASMPAASSRAPSRRTCRSCRQPNSNWSSMPRPPGCLASTCRRCC
jgi:putative ABC transport system substrate-binding protein